MPKLHCYVAAKFRLNRKQYNNLTIVTKLYYSGMKDVRHSMSNISFNVNVSVVAKWTLVFFVSVHLAAMKKAILRT